jgi:hypothetical protein
MAKKSELQRKLDQIDADIVRLQGIRDYLLYERTDAEQPKRTRKPRVAAKEQPTVQ